LEYGYFGILEILFIFLIVFLVVGPRRIVRGIRVIRDWVRRRFRRAGRSKAANKGRRLMRGLGSMVGYYTSKRRKKKD
jgi:Sec-independent protein translocase protein TatA